MAIDGRFGVCHEKKIAERSYQIPEAKSTSAGSKHLFCLTLGAPLGILGKTFLPQPRQAAMVKIIALYGPPPDRAAFDEHYQRVHLPLLRKTPGLRRVEITNITGTPIGQSSYVLMAEMYYDSMEAMNSANASPEGRAAAKDLMSFAAKIVTVFFGEIQE